MITTEKTDQGFDIKSKVDHRNGIAFGGAEGPLYKSSNYYIFDARKGATPLLVGAKSVVASSPNRDNYKDFEKQNPVKYYMPIWSLTELSLLREHCFKEEVAQEEMEDRFSYYGGVPRSCLVGTFEKGNWQSIIDDCADVGTVMKMIGRSTVADSDKALIHHRLVHLVPSEDYKRVTLQFGSQKICDAFLMAHHKNVEEAFIFFIKTKTDAIYAGLRGQLFEAYAHRIIAAGGSFKILNLTDVTATTTELVLPPADIEYFSDIPKIVSFNSSGSSSGSSSSSSSSSASNNELKPKYFIPQSKKFAVVDSFSDDGLFQMTVSDKHPIPHHLLKKLLDTLKYNDKPRLYFVVPEDNELKLQKYLTTKNNVMETQPVTPPVEQFALYISMAITDKEENSNKKAKI